MQFVQITLMAIILQLNIATPALAQGMLGNIGLGSLATPAQDQSSPVLAQSPYGNLTVDSVNAYMEALAFCLQQIGQPGQFTQDEEQQITQALTDNFPALPPEAQQALANARESWNEYRSNWDMLDMNQKIEFAYNVLAFAYGDQIAQQVLGLNTNNTANTGQGSSSDSGYSGFSEPCYTCTEAGSMIYGGAIDMGGGEFSY